MKPSELRRNRRALDNAIAQQRLEGLEVTPETVALLEQAARGEITTAEIIRQLQERYDMKLAQNFMKKRRNVFRQLAKR